LIVGTDSDRQKCNFLFRLSISWFPLWETLVVQGTTCEEGLLVWKDSKFLPADWLANSVWGVWREYKVFPEVLAVSHVLVIEATELGLEVSAHLRCLSIGVWLSKERLLMEIHLLRKIVASTQKKANNEYIKENFEEL
jgi:hypothetical protein